MSKKILIIEDEEDVIEIVKTILKTKNYQVFSAINGEEGLKMIKDIKPDLVICDLMMPKVSGLEVCKRLRRDPELKDIPILIMSAIGKDSKHPEEFWREGLKADDFISKPFDPLDLLGRIEYVFRRKDYISVQENNNVPIATKERVKEEKISESAAAVPILDLKVIAPEEVVKVFIESWNSQRFQQEFNCLGEEMTYGLQMQDYVARRRQFFNEQKEQKQIQKMKKLIESSTRQNVAKVICEKEVIIGERSIVTEETYLLKKTYEGWKMVSVKIKK